MCLMMTNQINNIKYLCHNNQEMMNGKILNNNHPTNNHSKSFNLNNLMNMIHNTHNLFTYQNNLIPSNQQV